MPVEDAGTPGRVGRIAEEGGEGEGEGKSMMDGGETLPVRVIARARPLLPFETSQSTRSCVTFYEDGHSLVLGKDRAFTFDAVYQPNCQQQRIYDDWVSSLVDGCFQGYNATVLAYGQTGAGKTYTMGSADNSGRLEEELGIVPRVMKEVFGRMEAREEEEGAEVEVKVSYIEIYNEEVKDLLHPSTPSKHIAIRERADGTIVMAGVREERAESLEEMQRLLEEGSLSRTVAGTLMNTQSSRSHSIFTLNIRQRVPRESGEGKDLIRAKFHLVDLAGSERAKRTGNIGVRLKESVNINSGLLALGNVISALGDERKRASHVPYRQSKLTRMLQDSLGGNSRTVMVACISPAEGSLEETLNTLKYANRARNIRNVAVVNRAEEREVGEGEEEVLRLKAELDRLQNENRLEQAASDREQELESKVLELQEETRRLSNDLTKTRKTAGVLEEKVRRLGARNLELAQERDSALAALEHARDMASQVGGRLRRMNETDRKSVV